MATRSVTSSRISAKEALLTPEMALTDHGDLPDRRRGSSRVYGHSARVALA